MAQQPTSGPSGSAATGIEDLIDFSYLTESTVHNGSLEALQKELELEDEIELAEIMVYVYLRGTKVERAKCIKYLNMGRSRCNEMQPSLKNSPFVSVHLMKLHCYKLIEELKADPNCGSYAKRLLQNVGPDIYKEYDYGTLIQFVGKLYPDCRPFRRLVDGL